jgi:hypothetical protein
MQHYCRNVVICIKMLLKLLLLGGWLAKCRLIKNSSDYKNSDLDKYRRV